MKSFYIRHLARGKHPRNEKFCQMCTIIVANSEAEALATIDPDFNQEVKIRLAKLGDTATSYSLDRVNKLPDNI